MNRDLANFIDKENLLHRFPGMRIWFGGEVEQQQALGNINFDFLRGILFGTLVSLLLLPCLYAAEQDLRKILSKLYIRDRKLG